MARNVGVRRIVAAGHGTDKAWRVQSDGDGRVALWHYSTKMLSWHPGNPTATYKVESTGWGSVSDQSGMNAAFDALGVVNRYDRAGGAKVSSMGAMRRRAAATGRIHVHVPAYTRKWPRAR